MKRIVKILVITFIAVIAITTSVLFTACNKKEEGNLRFTAPEGTPALAMAKLVTDNKVIDGKNVEYAVVNPSNIAVEMSSKSSDIVIMPVNGGANLIRQGAEYKLVSVAVDGSLFIVGKTTNGGNLSVTDLIGKKVACIGKTGVPGLIFRYVMKNNNVNIIEEGTPDATNNEVFVEYVSDGSVAKTALADNKVDFALVGEPAATAFKAALGCNAELNMQNAYAACNSNTVKTFPQAGLFVKKELASNESFMSELFSALTSSKEWITANPKEITEFVKTNLYESAVFPAASIPRCAINVAALTDTSKTEIITFLNSVANKDASGNPIDWSSLTDKLF